MFYGFLKIVPRDCNISWISCNVDNLESKIMSLKSVVCKFSFFNVLNNILLMHELKWKTVCFEILFKSAECNSGIHKSNINDKFFDEFKMKISKKLLCTFLIFFLKAYTFFHFYKCNVYINMYLIYLIVNTPCKCYLRLSATIREAYDS